MKIDIIINRKAGTPGRADLIEPVRSALSHCGLDFHLPESIPETRDILSRVVDRGTDCLMICGGDGTLNSVLDPLVERMEFGEKVPPLCLIPTGTANDLASTLGVSRKIGQAARAAYEGKIRNIDILEITSEKTKSYMITNGGMGIPAETAFHANRAKEWAKSSAKCTLPKIFRPLSYFGKKAVNRAGSKIYEAMLVRELLRWEQDAWEIHMESPDHKPAITRAPMILVNNQSSIGGNFVPAPMTLNHDGKFNVFLFSPTRLMSQVKSIVDIKRGKITDRCPNFETTDVKFTVPAHAKPFTFFGDGEIIHRDVRELAVRCIHPGLPVFA